LRYLFESVEAGQDRPAYPSRVFTLRWRIDLDLDVFESQLFDFVEEAVTES
jgi:hypothetical protein